MTTPPPPPAAADGGRVHRRVETPLGTYVLAADHRGLIGVWRLEQKRFPTALRMGAAIEGPHPVLDEAERQLREYLAGTRVGFELPLAPDGTPFQQAVWQQLTAIPRGGTTTYGEIARALGRPRAAQAVGAAVGANPLSIVVPCHRVMGTSGALTGYAGGIETKQALLVLEGVLLA